MASRFETEKLRRIARRLRHPSLLGLFGRTSPVSGSWGFDRGTPVDRYYIEAFLDQHRADIHGRVLEIKNSDYSRRFGSKATQFDVLDIDSSNPNATIFADLSKPADIPAESFNCFVLTQTLQLIFDFKAVIENASRLLRPEGVLLASVPCVSRIAAEEGHDYWRFTPASCARIFGDVFGAENVSVRGYGNVLTCCAFLQGVAYEELTRSELEFSDESFPLVIVIRAVKGK